MIILRLLLAVFLLGWGSLATAQVVSSEPNLPAIPFLPQAVPSPDASLVLTMPDTTAPASPESSPVPPVFEQSPEPALSPQSETTDASPQLDTTNKDASAVPNDNELVELNFPNEVDLEVLIEYVSQRLQLKILFDEAVVDKKIRLRTTGEIPVDSLLQVLQSALKMKELTMVDAEVSGWKRIVPVAQLGILAPQGNAQQILSDSGGATPVMQIFTLKYADLTQVQQLIQPFLTPLGSLCTPIKEANVLVLSDYAANVLKAAELIKTLDVPKPTVTTEFLEVKHVDATDLSRQITSLLQARTQATGEAAQSRVNITADSRTNQLILTGTTEEIASTKELIESLDVATNLTTNMYSLEHVDVREIDSLVKSFLDPLHEKLFYRSVVNRNDNSLVVTTTAEIHEQIAAICKRLNVPTTQKQSPIRFYKLNHTTVDEVMSTLNSLRQGTGMTGNARDRDGLRTMLPGSQKSFNHIGGAVSFPLKPNESLPLLTPDTPPLETGVEPPVAEPDSVQSQQTTGPVSMMTALLDNDVRITADSKTNNYYCCGRTSNSGALCNSH
ncbi:MAG: secretin N-terminal domain-containing protein [Planctomycetia bacterium]|nr:secretin N-terminal domain-containing protein [Planctomycetia bacterium]